MNDPVADCSPLGTGHMWDHNYQSTKQDSEMGVRLVSVTFQTQQHMLLRMQTDKEFSH